MATPFYDSLSVKTPDYSGKFPREWSGPIPFQSGKAQVVRYGADGASVKVTDLSSNKAHFVNVPMNNISTADKNTIWDIWNDSAKANGFGRTFLWDGFDEEDKTLTKSYVVRFAASVPVTYGMTEGSDSISQIRLQIVGKPA